MNRTQRKQKQKKVKMINSKFSGKRNNFVTSDRQTDQET